MGAAKACSLPAAAAFEVGAGEDGDEDEAGRAAEEEKARGARREVEARVEARRRQVQLIGLTSVVVVGAECAAGFWMSGLNFWVPGPIRFGSEASLTAPQALTSDPTHKSI